MANSEELRRKTRQLALCGMLGALAVAVMMLGGLIPFMTYCCPALASLALLPALDACGAGMSVGLYAVVGILSLLLAPDKEAAFLFVFIGYYPILRPYVGRVRLRFLRIACKLVVFNAAILLMYWLLLGVVGMPSVAAEFETYANWLLAVMLVLGNGVFLLFDVLLERIGILYRKRLRPQVQAFFRL